MYCKRFNGTTISIKSEDEYNKVTDAIYEWAASKFIGEFSTRRHFQFCTSMVFERKVCALDYVPYV